MARAKDPVSTLGKMGRLEQDLKASVRSSGPKGPLGSAGPPGAAKITEYEGPVFLDFHWQLEDEIDAEVPSANGHLCGEHQLDFYDIVLEFGFPHFYSYYEAVRKGDKEPSLDEAQAALSLDEDTFPETSTPNLDLDDLEDAFRDAFDDE